MGVPQEPRTLDDERSELVEALPAYDFGPVLGRSAFAVVFAARHRGLEREVAVKLLSRKLLRDAEAYARFGAEARLLATLDHPHVVRVYDHVERERVCALVMERLTGGTLATRQRVVPLQLDAACAVMIAALHGLEHAHRNGVLHCDVKPENLLFGEHDLVKVTGFGIANVLGPHAALMAGPGPILGTPAFMAPEQVVSSAGPVSPATDVYAVGAILYELLSGMPVFPRDKGMSELLLRRIHDEAPPLRAVAPDVPEELAGAVMRAVSRDPQNRYPSAGEFAAALEAAMRAGDLEAARSSIQRLKPEGSADPRPPDSMAGTVVQSLGGRVADTGRLRAVVADDQPFLREAIANMLRQDDIVVVAEVGDADAARQAVADAQPDIAILDIRMPPMNHLDGLNAAIDIRERTPDIAILLMSNHLETQYLDALLGSSAKGVGYLLKDRVTGAREFVDAVRRVAAGACVIDPEVVAMLLHPTRRARLQDLTEREREVLSLMAEGRSNQAICAQLGHAPGTVDTHVRQIFTKLGLMHEPDYHRRVLAILAHLGGQQAAPRDQR